MSSAGNNDARLRVPDQRLDHFGALTNTLASCVFIQLACSYYYDNLSILLVLRTAAQVLFVDITASLGPVLFINVICILTHVLHAAPAATARSARGYIHGSLFVDLVGEPEKTSKWRLLSQDVLICALQLIMLAIAYERYLLTEGKKETTPPQTLDAEEEGRQEGVNEDTGETEDGIEMQTLLPHSEEATASGASAQNDLVLTLNVRRSLKGLVALNKANSTVATVSSASERADRLRALLMRIAAERAGAGTAAATGTGTTTGS
ncbi:uncharacterized protein HMPREF1541_08191 [Cyphellophora europaea CBS 101466]|uniref:DUF1746 domain-containing protein n=1 Tax=Cyphellophora europaea (strain CBS 101466) TaxID=1220924 RepID=W2RL25_CYPE1|nr:uncharacterized protein HMPREF1541_08191 [Cyphellophora europaea CBS 101466]ETN37201.1 hypothetical protein HMPREF1541_08191 [Cyphellophora europaea CBS 101466]